MSTNGSSQDSGGLFNNSNFLILFWVLSFFFFLVAPFCISKRGRMKCIKRIRERRWNVYMEPEQEESWYRGALERYERYVLFLCARVMMKISWNMLFMQTNVIIILTITSNFCIPTDRVHQIQSSCPRGTGVRCYCQ
jgi:hypothetical protein